MNIENIEYKSKKTQTTNSFEDLKKNIELLPKVLKLFQEIRINKLKIDDNEFEIVLNDEILYLDNKYVNLSSKIDVISNQVVFELYSLYLKDVDLLLDGKIKIDYFNEKLNYYGKFYYQDIQSSINVEMTKDLAKFYLVSEPFKSLKFLKKFLRLDEVAEAWMYDNVEGDIKLQEFYGEYDLKNNHIIESSLQGKAQIKEAKIRFHKDVDVVNTKSLDISFKNDKLDFNLIEPTFKNKSLAGSYVTIHNLTSEEKGQVDVFIKANSKLDKDILDILKAYKINLPLIQKSGNTQASLLMKFPYDSKKHMSTYGEFFLNDAQISINNFTFDSKKGEVILNDSMIEIKNSDFKYKNMIDAVVNINLDTKTLKSSGDANIKSFLIKKDNNESIVDIKNKQTNLEMDFNKQVTILLKDLGTKIEVADLINVNIDDLSKIYPYSKLLKDTSIKEGNITLQIKDEKNMSFNAFIKGLDLPIQRDNKNIDSLDINGKIEDGKTTVSSKDEDLKIEIADKLNIYLRNLDVMVDSKLQNSGLQQDMNINLLNSKLKVGSDIYHLEKGKISILNKAINFEVDVKELNLPIRKNNDKINSLSLIGSIKNGLTSIETKNKDLILELKKDAVSLYVDGYNLYYSSSDSEKIDENKYKEITIKGKNSNIIINEKYKLLSDNFEVRVRDDSKFISLDHKLTNITFKESKDKKIDVFSNNLSDEFINAVFDKHIFEGGNILLHASGTIDNLNGKIIIENSNIKDLAILNNLLIFIQTSPGLINPLLAIPSVVGMATNSGFNLTAYKIVNGNIEFNYSKEKNLLDVKKLLTIGNGIDFDGRGQIDLNTMMLDSTIKLIFLKDYSKIVGMIPVVNYVLLGDNNRVETEVNLNGSLDNPELSTNLTKDTITAPVNIGKRILNSPVKLFDFIMGKDPEEEIKNKESQIVNKPLK
ncbi:MAG: AsmA-like C-terminal domain-containing protein [Aliarcobacter sp.]|nr:AsmA-like C-terminal domain-containing protein [Aliarcobacter sp.]MDD2887737.1 AsmA-like C-terminal domain-containing protein [Aliarcobacter sp.]